MPGILVFGEMSQSGLGSVTGELLGVARSLSSETGDEVSVVLLCDSVGDEADEAIALGADKVYRVENSLLSEPQIDAHLEAFGQVVSQSEPSIIVIGRTPLGRDVGPRLAFRLGVAVAQDCVRGIGRCCQRTRSGYSPRVWRQRNVTNLVQRRLNAGCPRETKGVRGS